MGRPVAEPYTLAFECSGNAAAAESAFDQLDYAGTLVFVGTGHEMPRINHNRAIVLELTIIAAYNYDIEGFAPALELLASGQLPLDPLIEADDVCLDDVLGHDAPPRGRRAARQGHGPPGGLARERPDVRAAAQPRRDQHGSRRCSTTRAAPSCSTSTATCSAGPRATTPARPATR